MLPCLIQCCGLHGSRQCHHLPVACHRMARVDLLAASLQGLPLSSASFVKQACCRATITNGLGIGARLALPGTPEHVAPRKNRRSLQTGVFRFGVLPHLKIRLEIRKVCKWPWRHLAQAVPKAPQLDKRTQTSWQLRPPGVLLSDIRAPESTGQAQHSRPQNLSQMHSREERSLLQRPCKLGPSRGLCAGAAPALLVAPERGCLLVPAIRKHHPHCTMRALDHAILVIGSSGLKVSVPFII